MSGLLFGGGFDILKRARAVIQPGEGTPWNLSQTFLHADGLPDPFLMPGEKEKR